MNVPQGYILLLSPGCDDTQAVRTLLHRRHCSVFMAHSADQAVARIEQSSPYLVILSGTPKHWSTPFVQYLRQQVDVAMVTIVALTDSAEPSWLPQEDYPDLDGFLVKPLSDDVLTSLVESAIAKTDLKIAAP